MKAHRCDGKEAALEGMRHNNRFVFIIAKIEIKNQLRLNHTALIFCVSQNRENPHTGLEQHEQSLKFFNRNQALIL